jgi:hypothetical protein
MALDNSTKNVGEKPEMPVVPAKKYFTQNRNR